MGQNLPPTQYAYFMTPIALERSAGVGLSVTDNLELRLTNHRVDWLVRDQNYLGAGDLGKNGPFSLYTTVSARWYFGGYGRRARAYQVHRPSLNCFLHSWYFTGLRISGRGVAAPVERRRTTFRRKAAFEFVMCQG